MNEIKGEKIMITILVLSVAIGLHFVISALIEDMKLKNTTLRVVREHRNRK